MANNSTRKAIQFLVEGALPPHDTNVLWMDTSVPELPVLKTFWNGCWTPVHTDDSKEIAMLAQIVLEQQAEIASLTEDVAKESSVSDDEDTTIGMLKDEDAGLEAIKTAIENVSTTTESLAKEDNVARVVKTEYPTIMKCSYYPGNYFVRVGYESGYYKWFRVDGYDMYLYTTSAGALHVGSPCYDSINPLVETGEVTELKTICLDTLAKQGNDDTATNTAIYDTVKEILQIVQNNP